MSERAREKPPCDNGAYAATRGRAGRSVASALAKGETLGRNCRPFGHFMPAGQARAACSQPRFAVRKCTDNALDLAEAVMQSA
jgi:hypothetical protein